RPSGPCQRPAIERTGKESEGRTGHLDQCSVSEAGRAGSTKVVALSLPCKSGILHPDTLAFGAIGSSLRASHQFFITRVSMFAALNPLISRPFHTRSSAASSALCKALRRTSAWSASRVLVVGLGVVEASRAESAAASPDSPDRLARRRELYLQARQAKRKGHIADYLALRPQLSDYPLLPYLDYHDLSPQLAASAQRGSGYEAVDSFLSRHRGSWLGDRLERQWVDALAAEQRWDDLL